MDKMKALRAFSALSQATRLDVFRELIRAGDAGMLSGEVGESLGVRQNTMSTNLAILLDAGLIRNEREGRSVRYFADLDGVRGLLGFVLQECCGGRPDLCQPLLAQIGLDDWEEVTMPRNRYKVLFVCTGNSARSIMAEAILNRVGKGRFEAFSAGSQPKGEVHPEAMALLRQLNYPADGIRSKDWQEFAEPGASDLDFIFTLCDSAAAETCPAWPGQPMTAHWGVADPSAVTGEPARVHAAFFDAYRVLERRISIFTSLPLDSIEKLSLQQRLKDIGKTP